MNAAWRHLSSGAARREWDFRYDTSCDHPDSAMEEELQISKTQRKREMQALQELGEELVALGADKLAELELPSRLLDAVLDAKRISKFGALRRQMQYLGRLMRDADADAIRSQLDVWKGASVAETARVHAIERWRTRLIGDELALGELLDQYPRADAQRLRALVRNIKREAAAKKPKSTGATSTSTAIKPGRAAAPKAKAAARAAKSTGDVKAAKPLNDTTITAVVKDAARLLTWGRDWHELPEAIARMAGRPSAQQVRQILKTSKSAIEQRAAAQEKD